MLWGRKKEKRTRQAAARSKLIPEGISSAPELPPLPDMLNDTEAPDAKALFKRVGSRVWDLLKLRRMRSWFPDDSVSEFRRYHKLAKATPELANELFIGLDPESSSPIFVPRHVLSQHGYILGGTGSGKTSHALTQLLLQLGEPRPGVDRSCLPPILIIDCKREGDRYFRAFAETLARMRGSRLRFFSNDSDYKSLDFDPIEEIRASDDPIKFLETLLKAFGLIYPLGYGSDFFTSEQRTELMRILFDRRPSALDELISFVDQATRGRDGNKDARGLYSALAVLGRARHIHTGHARVDRDQLIDLRRFYREREVLYVHLNSQSAELLTRDIGRLLLYSLMAVAERRTKAGEEPVQVYVAIDEFHTIAAGNIVDLLNQARSIGVSFILSHQSSSSLKTRDRDLYGTLFENCHFKQWLELEDPRVIELLTLISGRKQEIRRGGATAFSTGTGHAHARSWSERTGVSYPDSIGFGARRFSEDQSDGGTVTFSTKSSRTDTESWREEMVPGITPEMITAVNGTTLCSLVHVKQEGESAATPLHGIPTLVQGLYPFSKDRAERMTATPWPMRPGWDGHKTIKKQAPLPLFPTPGATEPKAAKTLHKDMERLNEGEKRKLERKHRALVDALATEALPQRMSVERFAAKNRVTVKTVLEHVAELAKQFDIAVANKSDMLSPGLVIKLQSRLKRQEDTKPKR